MLLHTGGPRMQLAIFSPPFYWQARLNCLRPAVRSPLPARLLSNPSNQPSHLIASESLAETRRFHSKLSNARPTDCRRFLESTYSQLRTTSAAQPGSRCLGWWKRSDRYPTRSEERRV